MTIKDPKNECAICFAEKHGEIDLDKKRKDYKICRKHYKEFTDLI
jgi:hypothetical protein